MLQGATRLHLVFIPTLITEERVEKVGTSRCCRLMGKVVYFLSGTVAGVASPVRTNAAEQTRHRCIALQPERTLVISYSLSRWYVCMIPAEIYSYMPGRDKIRFTRRTPGNWNDIKKDD